MWHLLNYIPPPGQSRSALPAIIDSFNNSQPLRRDAACRVSPGSPLQLFAPSFVSLSETGTGKVLRTERPLLYHYIFLRGSEADIKQLCLSRRGFSFVLDRNTRRHITLTDEEVEQFRIIARFYSGKLPCYPLNEVSLEEGDKVQIVTGPCAGLTGTYMSRKGGKSGNILVAVDTTMAAIVYDVPAEYVRVLEFATGSRRVYDQLDAYADRLKPLLDKLSSLPCGEGPGVGTSPDFQGLVAASIVFVRRLGTTKISNPKLDAKRSILLYAACSLLGDVPAAESALDAYRRLSRHITNPKTQALCTSILTAFPAPPP